MDEPDHHTRLEVKCDPAFREILIAELAEAGFESFIELEDGVEAFVAEQNFDHGQVDSIRAKYFRTAGVEFSFSRIPKVNWNAKWESSFEPVIVDDVCIVRAAFHKPEKKFPYEIIITPKMSFGTGHHQTTFLMIRTMLKLDFAVKKVMDVGCGTAVLAILAGKMGAASVEAFDIDSWSMENTAENIEINGCANISIAKGSVRSLQFAGHFDVILANINKNVLIDELADYVSLLSQGGLIALSGFFIDDIDDLTKHARSLGLSTLSSETKDEWACLLLSQT